MTGWIHTVGTGGEYARDVAKTVRMTEQLIDVVNRHHRADDPEGGYDALNALALCTASILCDAPDHVREWFDRVLTDCTEHMRTAEKETVQ
jgi:hypothetical protein